MLTMMMMILRNKDRCLSAWPRLPVASLLPFVILNDGACLQSVCARSGSDCDEAFDVKIKVARDTRCFHLVAFERPSWPCLQSTCSPMRIISQLVNWCYEPSQPLGVTSGLNTNSNLSLSYSAHKSFNINHNIFTAQLFKAYARAHTRTLTHTHTHIKSHIFLQNHKHLISQLKYFSTQNLLQNTLYFIPAVRSCGRRN